MAKVLGIDQLLKKQYNLLTGLSENFKRAHGELESSFTMIIYGPSGHGKSNYTIMTCKELMDAMPDAVVMYVSLEEEHGKTLQLTMIRHEMHLYNKRLRIMGVVQFEELKKKLGAAKSAKVWVIDSIQYMNLSFEQYKELKAICFKKKKVLLMVSHATGRKPMGNAAIAIEYDCNIKVRVEGCKALITSRFGGNENFVIHEESAKKYWKKKYKQHQSR